MLIGYGQDELVLEVTDNGAGLPAMAGAGVAQHGSGLAGDSGVAVPSAVSSMFPTLVTPYCGYLNCQLHWKPSTFTVTAGLDGSLSM